MLGELHTGHTMCRFYEIAWSLGCLNIWVCYRREHDRQTRWFDPGYHEWETSRVLESGHIRDPVG